MRFDKSVTVATGPGGGVFQRVDDPVKAGEVLLDPKTWQAPNTAKHKAARKAVLKALQNAQDAMLADKARKAFEQAAVEAGLLRDGRPAGGLREAGAEMAPQTEAEARHVRSCGRPCCNSVSNPGLDLGADERDSSVSQRYGRTKAPFRAVTVKHRSRQRSHPRSVI